MGRRNLAIVAFGCVVLLGVLALMAREASQPASGGFGPPPLGVLLTVNTTAFPGVNDGLCSLDEAINAANINGIADACNASLSQSGATDSIRFEIGSGTPTIIVTSQMNITTPIAINGSGQATRVVLSGSGDDGFVIFGAGASGSSIRNLVLNNFADPLRISSASNVTVAGNFIGTNADGTAVSSNASSGIILEGASATIGGTSGLTPGGPCTGDCNVISGNGAAFGAAGISMINSTATIRGNFIGTDVTGVFPRSNGFGIDMNRSSATIGGTSAGAGNIISGNETGIRIRTDQNVAQSTVIQGNLIGTNAAGNSGIPNSEYGIDVYVGNRNYPLTIGGSAPGAGNVISGNVESGIILSGTDYATIQGNRIGTRIDGVSPLGNGLSGIQLSSSTHSNVIGGINPGEGNVIAFNGGAGVTIGVNNYSNQIRGNSIHSNAGKGIYLADSQAGFAFLPTITGFGSVHGSACPNCIVDIYSDSADEGKIYEGTVTANGAGNWSYNGPLTGPNVTVTATSSDALSPSQLSTSEFSAPMAVPATPTPSTTATPTPTSTQTATPTHTPTPTPASTPTITATPVPSPTDPSGPVRIWGDNNCSGEVDTADAMAALLVLAGLTYDAGPGCPEPGSTHDLQPAGFGQLTWGDVDCSGAINAVDALRLLRHVVTLPPDQQQNCPPIGSQVLVSP